MKKRSRIFTALLLTGVLATSMFGCGKAKTDGSTVTVRLNEVTRSVFYAPMYVAMSQGFFKDKGIDIDLQTGQAP